MVEEAPWLPEPLQPRLLRTWAKAEFEEAGRRLRQQEKREQRARRRRARLARQMAKRKAHDDWLMELAASAAASEAHAREAAERAAQARRDEEERKARVVRQQEEAARYYRDGFGDEPKTPREWLDDDAESEYSESEPGSDDDEPPDEGEGEDTGAAGGWAEASEEGSAHRQWMPVPPNFDRSSASSPSPRSLQLTAEIAEGKFPAISPMYRAYGLAADPKAVFGSLPPSPRSPRAASRGKLTATEMVTFR